MQQIISFVSQIAQSKCAILLYGTPRSFDSIVLPTLIEHVIKPNSRSQCDYFVHINLQEFDEAPSHPGRSGYIYANDTYLLEQAVIDIANAFHGSFAPIVKFVTSTKDESFERHRDLFLKMHVLKDKSGRWLYFPEIIHLWDGLQLVWNLMKTTQHENDVTYDYVAALRTDAAYLTPIKISDKLAGKWRQSLIISGSPTASIRDGFSQGISGEIYIAYGSYDAVQIWATERFAHFDEFLNRLTHKKMKSIMSERSFITATLVPRLKRRWISVEVDSIACALDVQPDESISLFGCGDPTTAKLALEKIIDRPCVPSYGVDKLSGSNQLLRCSWKQEKVVSQISSTKIKKDTAAICIIVSNEEYYLDEWLDYHLGLGFAHIYIYDNTDSFDLGHGWLDRRPRLDSKVTVHFYPGQDKQGSAYQHCGQNYLLGRHRWVGFFDADEYLVLKKHSTITSFLTEYCETGAISISWQLHSWNGRLQYSPEPVTKRFQGMHSVDQHVKTISNVDAVNWTVTHHPHYAFLKAGFQQVDTNGDEISPQWQNLRFPSDVALFFHHHCKSHKEYIGKRMRGRATMSGEALVKSRNELVEKAKNKVGFHNTTRIDSLAWEKLKSISPKYSLYDSPNLHSGQSGSVASSAMSNAICTVVFDDEAYVDEWVDYHFAVGFSKIYVVDVSDDFWMRQWGEEKSQTVPVEVIHFPGSKRDPSSKAAAFSQCIKLHQSNHDAMAFLDVNDFVIMPDGAGMASWNHHVQTSSYCAFPIQRILFGNAGQEVYDPLPVTKRFMFRVEETISSQSITIVKTKDNVPTGALDQLQNDLSKYLRSFQWKSKVCPGNPFFPRNIVVYHYLRSLKECKRDKADTKLCVLSGSVEDQFAWATLQKLLPRYSNFNGFL
eukprot:CCRYP_021192-RA/>CCRYP_021192-RA protein AED:0.16 eAED:0.16 QI:360/1/1/1/0.66/0.5/4/207/888